MLDEPWLCTAAPIAAAILASYITHRLHLRSDRLQRFNDLVSDLRPRLGDEVERPNAMRHAIIRNDDDALLAVLPWWRIRRYRAALREYREAKEHTTRDSHGGVFHSDVQAEAVRRAARRLLDVIQWQ